MKEHYTQQRNVIQIQNISEKLVVHLLNRTSMVLKQNYSL